MEALVGTLPQLADLIQKAGVVGLLLIICGVLAREVMRLRAENTKTFAQRDRWRLAYTIVKSAADAAGVRYDLRDLADLLKEDGAAA